MPTELYGTTWVGIANGDGVISCQLHPVDLCCPVGFAKPDFPPPKKKVADQNKHEVITKERCWQ